MVLLQPRLEDFTWNAEERALCQRPNTGRTHGAWAREKGNLAEKAAPAGDALEGQFVAVFVTRVGEKFTLDQQKQIIRLFALFQDDRICRNVTDTTELCYLPQFLISCTI